MSIESITVTRLADLRFGDRVKSCDGRPYSPVRVVQYELAPIEAGSAVRGFAWKTLTPPAPSSTFGIRRKWMDTSWRVTDTSVRR